ncbi:Uncharacterised protein [Chlamydia trachomatis]|nr:Uncharacterised protein [Chlamydia trachomatis]
MPALEVSISCALASPAVANMSEIVVTAVATRFAREVFMVVFPFCLTRKILGKRVAGLDYTRSYYKTCPVKYGRFQSKTVGARNSSIFVI